MTTVYSASVMKPWQDWVAGSLQSANENWIPLCTHSSFYSVGLTCFVPFTGYLLPLSVLSVKLSQLEMF